MSIIKSDPDGSPLAEPSLKGNIVPDAKNTKKLMVLPWRPQLKPLFGSHHLLLSLKEFGVKPVFVKNIFIDVEIVISREISFQTLSSILDGGNEITLLLEIWNSLKIYSLCKFFLIWDAKISSV